MKKSELRHIIREEIETFKFKQTLLSEIENHTPIDLDKNLQDIKDVVKKITGVDYEQFRHK